MYFNTDWALYSMMAPVGTGAFVCCLVHRGSTNDLLLLQIFIGVVWQTMQVSSSVQHFVSFEFSSLLLHSIKRDLFVYRDDSLTS